MRRVSIGIELVAAPDVLVLDEPTSGLDSVSAARLVKLLKNLADGESKTTIIASIHQPSSAHCITLSIRWFCLLRGKQLYFGPGGTRPAEFFAEQGRVCPPGYNIADHLLEIASAPIGGLATGTAAVTVCLDIWLRHEYTSKLCRTDQIVEIHRRIIVIILPKVDSLRKIWPLLRHMISLIRC